MNKKIDHEWHDKTIKNDSQLAEIITGILMLFIVACLIGPWCVGVVAIFKWLF